MQYELPHPAWWLEAERKRNINAAILLVTIHTMYINMSSPPPHPSCALVLRLMNPLPSFFPLHTLFATCNVVNQQSIRHHGRRGEV